MRLCLLAFLLLAGVLPVRAQNAYNGSLYSRYGLGELLVLPSSRAQAMGGGGYALSSPAYVSFTNPASLSNQVLTRLSLGGFLEGIEITDANDEQTRLSDGGLGAVQLAFPITDFKLGVGLQYAPYSRVSYQVRRPGEVISPVTGDTARYNVSYEGSGGLQRVEAGVGYALTPQIRVGATVGGLFGLVEEGRRTTFQTGGYENSTLSNSTRLSGFVGGVGVQGLFAGVGAEGNTLGFGASLTLPAKLTGRRVQTLGESLDRDTLSASARGSATLPLALSGGVSYSVGGRWTFVADGRYEPWSRFESDFAFPGYAPDGENRMADRVRLSTGAEVIPAGNRPFGPYFTRIAYRLGALYDRSYVDPVSGYTLDTYALTGGLSLPTLLPGTQLDLNLEVGTRGEAQNVLVQDRYYRIGLIVNIGERWFERQKLR